MTSNPPEIMIVSMPKTKLKKYLAKLTSKSLNKRAKDVTLTDVIELLATEIPEIFLMVAEENFFRGYKLGLDDKSIAFDNEETYEQENGDSPDPGS